MSAWCVLWMVLWAGDEGRWPALFGPTGDSVVPAQGLDVSKIREGMKPAWRMELGEGYSCPSIEGDWLITFHREGDEEIVDGVSLATRERRWRFAYPTRYVDRYGYNNGPRATPIIHEGVVYTLGAEGKLHALRLETGAKLWERWLNRDFDVEQDFFGVAGSPVWAGERLILNVGGTAKNASVVAIDCQDGKTEWQAGADGPSYATPIVGTFHGRSIAAVFTKAGLLGVETSGGKLLASIPFRSKLYESVNASSPIVVGNLVLVSATYGTGTLCVEVQADGSFKELWRSVRALDSHFSNVMHRDGFVYGFAGRHEPDAELRCLELRTGKVRWSVPTALGRGSMIRHGDDWILWGERGHLLTARLTPERAPELPADFGDRTPLLRYPCWTPPAVAGGQLYLRNETTLLAFDLR